MQAVQRLESQILLGKAVAGAAPVQRRTAHGHRPRDDARRGLILDEVAGPGILAVARRALRVPGTTLCIEEGAPRFDDGDAHAGALLGELLRQHCGRDARADDADVRFVGAHDGLQRKGAGRSPELDSPRQVSRRIDALYSQS